MTAANDKDDFDPGLERVLASLTAIANVTAIICDGVSRAVDEVVDPVRSGRWEVSQLLQPEKTVIGIRVENILRMDLGLERAKHLDVVVDGTNVDIKFTINSNWTIPPEALNEICLLTRYNVASVTVSAGLFRATDENLNRGLNRDQKRSVSLAGRESIRWLLKDEHPSQSLVGFLATIEPDLREQITDTSVGAQERLNRLFLSLKYQPIPETVVQAVASGHADWPRRLRPDSRNPKAPDSLGFEVLRSTSPDDRRKIAALGLPQLLKGHCIAVDPQAD